MPGYKQCLAISNLIGNPIRLLIAGFYSRVHGWGSSGQATGGQMPDLLLQIAPLKLCPKHADPAPRLLGQFIPALRSR